jgi:hypothetical protein
MYRLALISITFALIFLPLVASGHPDERRGLRRAIGATLLFNTLYVLLLIVLYPTWRE